MTSYCRQHTLGRLSASVFKWTNKIKFGKNVKVLRFSTKRPLMLFWDPYKTRSLIFLERRTNTRSSQNFQKRSKTVTVYIDPFAIGTKHQSGTFRAIFRNVPFWILYSNFYGLNSRQSWKCCKTVPVPQPWIEELKGFLLTASRFVWYPIKFVASWSFVGHPHQKSGTFLAMPEMFLLM